MAKITSRNSDFLKTHRNSTSPKVYQLLIDLVNDNREDLANEVIKIDYLVDYFNTCIKKRDKREGKETLERINARLSKIKKEGVDVSHFEYLCENILKNNKIKL
ncbi:hypothetical protein [Clostridium sp.]|uniref:hypothetical protein n=1 Tax=Clostridium sp. TaxID=1506 RepID=UPI002639D1E3|nr:hypothetical protein [Clostridium sp.]